MASAQHDTAKLEQLSGQVNQLRQDLLVLSRNPAVRPQIESLCYVSENAASAVAQNCIVKSLAFQDMYGRYKAVDDAHYKTFRWIFSHGLFGQVPGLKLHHFSASSHAFESRVTKSMSQGQQARAMLFKHREEVEIDTKTNPVSSIDGTRARARDALVGWLLGGDGIFHISGKMGSGKSTLMKFLCEQKMTMTLLQQWAGKCSDSQFNSSADCQHSTQADAISSLQAFSSGNRAPRCRSR
jgi:hypothetical protein